MDECRYVCYVLCSFAVVGEFTVKSKWLLESAVLLVGLVSGAITIWTFVVPQAVEKARRDEQIEIARLAVSLQQQAGIDTTEVERRLAEGNPREAVALALENVALPDQDESTILESNQTYQITPYKLPASLDWVSSTGAILLLNGQRVRLDLASPYRLPTPDEDCQITLMSGNNEGANRGSAEFLIQCASAGAMRGG